MKTITIPETFAELEKAVPLRPITSKTAARKALKLVECLALRPDLNKDQGDYLATLSLLIHTWEEAQGEVYAPEDVSSADIEIPVRRPGLVSL